MPSGLRKIVFSGIVLGLFLIAGEAGLHVIGFHFQRSLSYMRFAFPDPNQLHNIFIEDPALIWRMRPHYDFGKGYPRLNAQGFRGNDFSVNKPAGTFRMACLGDSVTFGQAGSSYPALLQKALAEKEPGKNIEVLNFGVPGYSSWQGLKLLQTEVLKYKPDAVTIFFGWNDHWLARGFSDSEQVVKKSRLFFIKDVLSRARVYQALNYLVYQAQAGLRQDTAEQRGLKLRVPKEQFRQNLNEMIDLCDRQGIKVILITAPDAIGLAPLPEFLLSMEFIRPGDDLKKLHQSYADAVREAALQKGAGLVDAQGLFERSGSRDLFDNPKEDLIHPNDKGMNLIAGAVVDKL